MATPELKSVPVVGKIRFPKVSVKLTKQDGDVFALISVVRKAMLKSEPPVSDAEIKSFIKEAMSEDYNEVLRTILNWINVT